MNSIFFKDTSSASGEVKEPEEKQNLQEAGNLRYIVVNSRMYQIFEDAPSVKVCSA